MRGRRLLALTAAPLVAAALVASAAQAATVTVQLRGLQPRGGQVLVSLQSRAQYMTAAGVAGASIAGDQTGAATVILRDVPPGDYALTVLHDANGDGAMATGFLGRPLEGWTTHNADKLRGAPTFDRVHVVVGADLTLTETMRYPQRGSRAGRAWGLAGRTRRR